MIPVLIVLFGIYVAATAWFMRSALAATDPQIRRREAQRLLWTTALGVPLLVAFIFAI